MRDMDFLKSFHTAAKLLPERLWRAAYTLDESQRQSCEEFRVRVGRPFAATVAGRPVNLGTVIPEQSELEELLARATESSVHTYLDQLWNGFLTTRQGHRLGLCGQAPEGDSRLLRGLSSVNLRIARQVAGLGEELELCGPEGFRSTVILAPPGGGKTTLLRELCRELSGQFRVALADERYEVAACAGGEPRFSVGSCDVLSGGKKRDTVPMLLRSMSPQILAVDEITQEEDCGCLLECVGCGCGLLATAHGQQLSDLYRRPAYRRLMEAGVFQQAVVIRWQGGARSYTLQPLPEAVA